MTTLERPYPRAVHVRPLERRPLERRCEWIARCGATVKELSPLLDAHVIEELAEALWEDWRGAREPEEAARIEVAGWPSQPVLDQGDQLPPLPLCPGRS